MIRFTFVALAFFKRLWTTILILFPAIIIAYLASSVSQDSVFVLSILTILSPTFKPQRSWAIGLDLFDKHALSHFATNNGESNPRIFLLSYHLNRPRGSPIFQRVLKLLRWDKTYTNYNWDKIKGKSGDSVFSQSQAEMYFFWKYLLGKLWILLQLASQIWNILRHMQSLDVHP